MSNTGDPLTKALEKIIESQNLALSALTQYSNLDLSKENEKLRETVQTLLVRIELNEKKIIELRSDRDAVMESFRRELALKRKAQFGLNEKLTRDYVAAGLERDMASIRALRDE